MRVRRPVWEEQAVNTNKMEVVAGPILSPRMSSLQSGSSPSSGSLFAPQPRGAGGPWLPWLPPLLAAPSWGRGFAESCFAVVVVLR